ncbi:MAG: hypothetical protein ACR2NZ_07905 [Rubripirellula sp.]
MSFTRPFHVQLRGSMLGEYKVNRCTRQCHELRRPLREGEWYYSVVLESGDDFVRRDYSAESWKEPPEGTIGWWKCRMPKSSDKKLVLAPPEVLTDLLRQMADAPERAKSRYLLALMLMRKRIVRPTETARDDTDSESPTELPFQVEVIATGETIDIPVCNITRAESETLRDELNTLLYCEAEEELDGSEDEELGE